MIYCHIRCLVWRKLTNQVPIIEAVLCSLLKETRTASHDWMDKVVLTGSVMEQGQFGSAYREGCYYIRLGFFLLEFPHVVFEGVGCCD